MGAIFLKPGDAKFLGSTTNASSGVAANRQEFAGSIELISMQFGVKQQMTTELSNSARTSGRPNLSEISLVKRSDPSSVALYAACLRAKPIAAGGELTKIFVAHGSDENKDIADFLTIELTDALVSSIETQSDAEGFATDTFTLNFTEIRWIWSSHESEGFGWSVATNRPS